MIRNGRYCTLAFLLAWCRVVVLAADGPPHVVVVLIDDLGAHDLACYGSDLHETPNIDQLAQEGVLFTAAYASSTVCTPSRAGYLTGQHPARLGMTIWHEAAAKGPNPDERLLPPPSVADLPLGPRTLAEVLKDAGYRTCHVGKWHLGSARNGPTSHGFDLNVGGTHWGAPATFFWPYRGFAHGEMREVPDLPGGAKGEYLTDRLTDEAIAWLRKAGEAPLFLNLCFHSVHTPIEGRPDLVEYYEQKLARGPPDRQGRADYAAMVHSVDQNVGRVVEALDQLGMNENTLLIVISDNGGCVNRTSSGVPTSNAPLRSGKGSLYEGGVRVPLIVRWPKNARAGATCQAPVVTHDLYATVVEACGQSEAAAETESDGLSLMPLLREPSASLPRDYLCWHFPHYYPTTTPVSSILRGADKLLYYYEDDRVELYDLEKDPGEKENLTEAKPEVARELQRRLKGWLTSVGARLPTPNPRHEATP